MFLFWENKRKRGKRGGRENERKVLLRRKSDAPNGTGFFWLLVFTFSFTLVCPLSLSALEQFSSFSLRDDHLLFLLHLHLHHKSVGNRCVLFGECLTFYKYQNDFCVVFIQEQLLTEGERERKEKNTLPKNGFLLHNCGKQAKIGCKAEWTERGRENEKKIRVREVRGICRRMNMTQIECGGHSYPSTFILPLFLQFFSLTSLSAGGRRKAEILQWKKREKKRTNSQHPLPCRTAVFCLTFCPPCFESILRSLKKKENCCCRY